MQIREGRTQGYNKIFIQDIDFSLSTTYYLSPNLPYQGRPSKVCYESLNDCGNACFENFSRFEIPSDNNKQAFYTFFFLYTQNSPLYPGNNRMPNGEQNKIDIYQPLECLSTLCQIMKRISPRSFQSAWIELKKH